MLAVMLWCGAAAMTAIAADADENASIKAIQTQTKELIDALAAFSAEQRDQAIEETETALDKIDERIDALQTRIDQNWSRMSATARKEARDNMRALRKRRVEVAEWYGSMKNSSADAWKKMKKGFSDAYQSLADAWKDAAKAYDASEQ
jgi:hypothetical protein